MEAIDEREMQKTTKKNKKNKGRNKQGEQKL